MNARFYLVSGLVVMAGLALPGSTQADPTDAYASLPTQISLVGTVRDFKARTETGGHTDFEWQPTAGYGHYVGEVADNLDSDGLPQFLSAGYLVSSEWRNSSSQNIMAPRSYLTAK